MKTKDCFDENGWLKDEYLWPLRSQIILGSIFVSDYENNFGIKAEKVCDFFTSFWDSYCEERAKEDGLWVKAVTMAKKRFANEPDASKHKVSNYIQDTYLDLQHQKYDNAETLLQWYGCFADECPLPPTYVNVDIHWDFARSIRVIASSEDEAYDIVDEMMQKEEIPRSTFEPTGDYELDTDWQPE